MRVPNFMNAPKTKEWEDEPSSLRDKTYQEVMYPKTTKDESSTSENLVFKVPPGWNDRWNKPKEEDVIPMPNPDKELKPWPPRGLPKGYTRDEWGNIFDPDGKWVDPDVLFGRDPKPDIQRQPAPFINLQSQLDNLDYAERQQNMQDDFTTALYGKRDFKTERSDLLKRMGRNEPEAENFSQQLTQNDNSVRAQASPKTDDSGGGSSASDNTQGGDSSGETSGGTDFGTPPAVQDAINGYRDANPTDYQRNIGELVGDNKGGFLDKLQDTASQLWDKGVTAGREEKEGISKLFGGDKEGGKGSAPNSLPQEEGYRGRMGTGETGPSDSTRGAVTPEKGLNLRNVPPTPQKQPAPETQGGQFLRNVPPNPQQCFPLQDAKPGDKPRDWTSFTKGINAGKLSPMDATPQEWQGFIDSAHSGMVQAQKAGSNFCNMYMQDQLLRQGVFMHPDTNANSLYDMLSKNKDNWEPLKRKESDEKEGKKTTRPDHQGAYEEAKKGAIVLGVYQNPNTKESGHVFQVRGDVPMQNSGGMGMVPLVNGSRGSVISTKLKVSEHIGLDKEPYTDYFIYRGPIALMLQKRK